MKKCRVAITADVGLDQDLISKLIHLHNAELLVIPKELNIPENILVDNKNEVFKTYKESHLKHVHNMMKRSDILLLPGNAYDIHPNHYGKTVIHPETQKKINPNPFDIRFDVEKKMLFCAVHKKIPIVAICGGMQLVNLAFGGSLVQHLPYSSSTISHRNLHNIEEAKIENWKKEFEKHLLTGSPKNIFRQHSHYITVQENSILGKIYKKYNPTIDLNNVPELSIHHQGIFKENLAPNLKGVATSYDGVIEALELIDYPSLFIATQYHFEYNVGNIANGIIKELISYTKV